MKVPERGDALEHVLDCIMLAKLGNNLSVIENTGGGPVLGKTAEMAGSNCEYRIEEVWMVVSKSRNGKLKMAVFVTQVKLSMRVNTTRSSCWYIILQTRTYPVRNLFDKISKKTSLPGVFQGEPSSKGFIFL